MRSPGHTPPRLRRIAFYQGVFRANFDGTMTTMTRVVEELRRRSVEHLVFTPLGAEQGDEPVAPIHLVPSIPFPLYPRYRIALPRRAAIWRALDEFEPDLVQIGTPDLGGKCVLNWALDRGVPAIGGYHTHFPTYLRYYGAGWLEPIVWKDLRRVYNSCARTLVPTRAVMQELQEKGIERLAHWPRGVDIDCFNPRHRDESFRRRVGAGPDDILIAYAGRLVAEKNVEQAARAFALVAEKEPRARFVFIGDGPREKAIRRILPQAAFPGYLTGEELHRAYASADVFCFVSRTETFGNVVLEAMASGLPVVTLRGTAMGELVEHGRCGILPRTPSPRRVAAALLALCNDPARRTVYARNARRFAESQSWEQNLAKQFELYEEVLAERARVTPAARRAGSACDRSSVPAPPLPRR